MNIAVHWSGAQLSPEGNIVGQDAGATLLRRLLRIFPGAAVLDPAATVLDPAAASAQDLAPDTVVITMDVHDTPALWARLRKAGHATPRLMNFVWLPVSTLESAEELAPVALSCALFPTFANSERTAGEIREMVNKWTVPPLAGRLKLGWVNLGFRLDHVQERHEPDVPVVLYPAIYLSPRKRPEFFMDVLTRVRELIPLTVEMRLHEAHLVSEKAMTYSRLPWMHVGPLTDTRTSYYEALAHTTAFLATAAEESYGLSYVEALGAGALGVFPDVAWARALLPEHYPFFYPDGDTAAAAAMLTRVLTRTAQCRADLDAACGGSFREWIAAHHSDDAFDREITAAVRRWFA
ncbi:glycosyltransferase family 1 protein [Schaalia turicensis]|uniref:glycosyltransferase family 1 protein n=1 Tax=Actinotignum sanguinis TaxID=1445614 RepID=UPI00237E732C|nr:glycosyltransferase family 1 protein [Actinotignum sanguinis]MDE1565873.1 glycosyltransferase family 1 protein [Actinotignum sanguinis]MDE1577629.1 glycosyltransferase family 1 protein [Actinotignum sanguinis]